MAKAPGVPGHLASPVPRFLGNDTELTSEVPGGAGRAGKLRTAITLRSGVRFGRSLWAFHVTFRDLSIRKLPSAVSGDYFGQNRPVLGPNWRKTGAGVTGVDPSPVVLAQPSPHQTEAFEKTCVAKRMANGGCRSGLPERNANLGRAFLEHSSRQRQGNLPAHGLRREQS